MMKSEGAGVGAIVASLAAGPVFQLSLGLAELYLQLPNPIEVSGSVILMMLMIASGVFLIGMFLAAPVNALGAVVMAKMGNRFDWARTRLAWALAGGLLGAIPLFLAPPGAGEGSGYFAFIVTAVVCASIARQFTNWHDVERDVMVPAKPRAHVVP